MADENIFYKINSYKLKYKQIIFVALLGLKLVQKYLYLSKFRYVIVGIFGAIFELFIFFALLHFNLNVFLSNVVAYHLAIFFCYFLHLFYTYRMPELSLNLIQFVKYISLMYIQLFCSMIILYILIKNLELRFEISKVIQIILITPLSYLFQKYLIFTKKEL